MDTSNNHETVSKSCNRLPLIPLSPLTQTSIEYAKALAQTTKSLSETDDGATSTSDIISLLNKDLSKEREKLDRLTKDIQNVQSQFLVDLNTYEIAKEIAYINCSLFRLVVLNKNWISNFDKQSNIVPLLDFHRYLSHSFVHQVIYSVAEEEEEASKKSTRRKSFISISNNNNMITQLIQIAYILFHIYRDFSGCTAILTSLQMPEVQRLEKLWSQCPTKIVNTYKELVVLLSPHNDYEAYHHHLWLHTARFLNTTPLKSQMIAVPFMHAHLTMIRNLIHTHSVHNKQKREEMVVLSDAGKKSFLKAIHVLEFCQQHLKIDPTELERPSTSRRLSTQSGNRSSNVGHKLSVSPCLELDKLHSNPNLYHWLVSRAYLTRSQLHHESLHVEPLAIGEIELETEEEYDLYWDFFRQDSNNKSQSLAVAVEPQPEQPQPEQQQKKKPQEEEVHHIDTDTTPIDHHQNIVDDLVIVAPDDSTTKTTENLLDNSVTQSSGILSLTPDAADNNTDLLKEDNTEIIIANDDVENVQMEEVEEEEEMQQIEDDEDDQTDIIIAEDEEEEEDKKMVAVGVMNDIIIESPIEIKESTAKEEGQGNVQQISDSVEAVIRPALIAIKPVLSPTAPVFVPQQQHTPAEDDIIILTEENYCDKEEEEEWTGYPIDNSASQANEEDEEDEEWTGYPIATEEEEEAEDDEIWKGYPVPSAQQQNSPRTIDLSTPSTPQEEQQGHKNRFSTEEWKGYQKTSEEQQQEEAVATTANNKKGFHPTIAAWDNNHAAIGKAAARRMQYSLSNTDNNRKRLPSSFTPSAST